MADSARDEKPLISIRPSHRRSYIDPDYEIPLYAIMFGVPALDPSMPCT